LYKPLQSLETAGKNTSKVLNRSDGFAKDTKTYGESFSAFILRSHGSGKGSVRVNGGGLEWDGATVGPRFAGTFTVEVASVGITHWQVII